MTYFRIILSIAVTVALAGVLLAQERNNTSTTAEIEGPKKAILVDEFGRKGEEEISAITDNFFIEISNDPTARGYILDYKGLDSLPSEYDESPNKKLIMRSIRFRRYDLARIVFVDGGFREKRLTQLYIVPDGADAPVPTDTIRKPKPPKQTYLWAHSWISTDEEGFDLDSEFVLPAVKLKNELDAAGADAALTQLSETETATSDKNAETDSPTADIPELIEPEMSPEEIQTARFSWADPKFGEAIAKRRAARGTIVLYADDLYYDVSRLLQFVDEGRDRIAAGAKIDASRIDVIYGGYRPGMTAEFWIVPENGKPPIPTPADREPEVPDNQ